MGRYWDEMQANIAYYMREIKEDLDRYMLNIPTRDVLCEFLDEAYVDYKEVEKRKKEEEHAAE